MSRRHLASAHSWRHGLLGLAVVVTSLFVVPALATPAFASTVSAGGPYTGLEGQPVTIQGSISGATIRSWSAARSAGGEKDHATCTFANATALSTQVWCNDDGMFDLTLTASDGGTSTSRLKLTNVHPSLTHVSPSTGTAVGTHSVVTVSATFRDGDPVDSHKYVIDWGDGSSSRAPTRMRLNGTGAFSGSHSYARGGHRRVTVTVFDSHGTSDSVTRALQVVGGASCPTVNGAGRLPRHRNSAFLVRGRCGSKGPAGVVRLRLPGVGQLSSRHLTLLRRQGHAATLAGTGRFRSTAGSGPGYGYVVSVLDRRTGRDKMNVVVRTPGGAVVLHARGRIAGGNITVRR